MAVQPIQHATNVKAHLSVSGLTAHVSICPGCGVNGDRLGFVWTAGTHDVRARGECTALDEVIPVVIKLELYGSCLAH